MHRQYPRPVQLRGRVVKSHTSEFGRVAAAFAEVAETEGFEPSVREFPVRRFSKPLVSATHPRLRVQPRCRKRGLYRADSLASTGTGSTGDHIKAHVEAHLFARV